MKDLKLLIKFPTRNRTEKFFKILDLYYTHLRTPNVHFVITCDIDDLTMNNDTVKSRLKEYPFLNVYYENNTCKVEAINNNLNNQNFDILLLASDDMMPVYPGYDKIIKEDMIKHFPDTDGVLWYNDGFQENRLNTLSILGKKYFDRFNYIYNPCYKSLYCDTEFTEVSINLQKVKYFNKVLIKHVQYSIVKEAPDELYIRNDSLEQIDRCTFLERKSKNYE
jgi:hypothetical protein